MSDHQEDSDAREEQKARNARATSYLNVLAAFMADSLALIRELRSTLTDARELVAVLRAIPKIERLENQMLGIVEDAAKKRSASGSVLDNPKSIRLEMK